MIVGLLVALVIVNVLYVLHLERKDARHDEQVNRLLVHIHAPEVAVATHVSEQAPRNPPAVDPFDDEDHWKAQEEALAEIARIEAGA